MKIFAQGSGGREYALAWHFSKYGHDVTMSPGNAAAERYGLAKRAPYTTKEAFADYFEKNGFDLAVAGPENPLRDGLGDVMHGRGLPFFGPRRAHARAEWDKGYLHELLEGTGLMPGGKVFRSRRAAEEYVKRTAHDWADEGDCGLVLKSTFLREGKGVILPKTMDEALEGIRQIMSPPPAGWGDDLLVQERLYGIELSTMTLMGAGGSGSVRNLASSKDNKAVGKNNFGLDPRLNTGGMGAESPHPYIPAEQFTGLLQTHTIPLICAVEEDADIGEAVGVVYNGLLGQTHGGGKVIRILESNFGRFGDPEIQPVLMRLRSDLAQYMKAAVDGTMDLLPDLEFDPRPAAMVVIATSGYPTAAYKQHTGKQLLGIDRADASDVTLFFAGVGEKDGKLINTGGRVFGVAALGDTREQAWEKAYAAIDRGKGIGIGSGAEDTQFRTDLKES